MADERRRILLVEVIHRRDCFKMLVEALAEQQGGAPIESVFDEQQGLRAMAGAQNLSAVASH